MADDLAGAFAILEKQIAEGEQKVLTAKRAINALCEAAKLPPRYPDLESMGDGGTPGIGISNIQPDTFYGKKQSTAVRMYMEMRKGRDLGPAKPREIFQALKEGGYQFESKDETVALIGLRALLRKNTVTFHKLPNGSYGLASWYPDAKSKRPSETERAPRKRLRLSKSDESKEADDESPAS